MSEIKQFTKRYDKLIHVITVSTGDDDWPPSNLRAFYQWIEEKIGEIPWQYRDSACLNISTVDDHDTSWPEIDIVYRRPETSAEMQVRAMEDLERQQATELKERKMLEELKAKYEE